MIFNRTTHEDLRETFRDAVNRVFGDTMVFLDVLENEKYSDNYDCFIDYGGENYIINRETGEYINWYKLAHLGRCITISAWFTYENNLTKWIEDFLTEFKESEGDIL